MEEFEADDFVLMYLKRRIECGNEYEWYDSPRLSDAMSPKWVIVERAALAFEKERAEKLQQLIIPLIEDRKLNFQTFCYVSTILIPLTI